jgi:hypothetical protein
LDQRGLFSDGSRKSRIDVTLTLKRRIATERAQQKEKFLVKIAKPNGINEVTAAIAKVHHP